MEVNLRPVEEIDLSDLERAMFEVLKATLQYPASTQVKGVKLAEDVRFFCNSADDGDEADELLWEVWDLLLEISTCAPPEHAWQTSLVQAVNILWRQDGPISGHDKQTSVWAEMPHFAARTREKWSDPTETGEELPEEFSKWKNLNSFVARITSLEFTLNSLLPIWQLRHALEEPPVQGSAMECRLWVACEWVLHCADVIYESMTWEEAPRESLARALGTGSICGDIPPQSVERWRYWKKKLAEFAADAEKLGFDSATAERLSDAVKRMETVEK